VSYLKSATCDSHALHSLLHILVARFEGQWERFICPDLAIIGGKFPS